MVNDQFMGRAQIAVVVEGKTYFGCCPACKEKLEMQASLPHREGPGDRCRGRQGERGDRTGRLG